ncbi:MAG TPA: hypothetical protein VIR58_15030 [Acidimicrobiales bacterium]
MGIGTSIIIIAAGAIMTFAIEVENAEGFNINNAGVILMIAGALGLIASMVVFGPRHRRTTVQDAGGRTVYHDEV